MIEESHVGPRDAMDEFLAELRRKGMVIDRLNVDGKFHGFHWNSYREKPNAGYKAIQTSLGIDIYFKNWKNPELNYKETISFKNLSEEELQSHRQKIEEHEEASRRRKEMVWNTVSLQAEKSWADAKEDATHPYIKKKKLKHSYGSRVNSLGSLYIPAKDSTGKIWNLQIIKDDLKLNLKGGRMKGLFHIVGEVIEGLPLYVCEGFATAGTVYEVGKLPAAITFGAGNFVDVGYELRKLYPNTLFIFSGDQDSGRTGLNASIKAARIHKGLAHLPKFKSPHPDYTDWNDLLDLEGEEEVLNQIHKYNEQKPQSAQQQWLDDYFKAHQIQFDYRFGVKMDGKRIKLEDILHEITLDADKAHFNLKKTLPSSYIHRWIRLEKEAVRNAVRDRIDHYDPEAKGSLIFYVHSITGFSDEVIYAVFAHFIWQVKRKIIGLPSEYHMMPILVGETGAGKSIAVERLLGPLDPLFSLDGHLRMLEDQREYQMLENNYVIVMDEMEKAHTTDLQAIKRVISSKTLTQRIMKENLHNTLENRATLIGTANEPIQAIIKDHTSIRRFYEIKCLGKEAFRANHAGLNGIDYLSIWHSVDPRAPSPIMAVLDQVGLNQEEMRAKSNVELFVEDYGLVPSENVFLTNAEIYEKFENWCRSNGVPEKFKVSMEHVGKELVRLGYTRFNRRVPDSYGMTSRQRGFYGHFS